MYKKIIFCDCRGEVISKNDKERLLDQLYQVDSEKIKLNDLCGLCASNKELIRDLFSTEGKILVIACHPRAVKLLLSYSGANSFNDITFINLRESEATKSIQTVAELKGKNLEKIPPVEISVRSDWPAWFPVLDYSRCTACGQCAEFCLFGVYKKHEKTVEVINPEACKNNCPACARICPKIAIVFPKYIHGGAISGSENIDEQEEQKRQMADMEKILGGDIYQALEQRKTKRSSIIKETILKKALEERDEALKNK